MFVERLMDAAKLLAETQFSQTVSRSACIVPLFAKNIREALKTTIPDRSLFGSDLTNLVKQLKEAEALFDQNNQQKKGNFRSPAERKPFLNVQGANTGALSLNRPRLYFRGQRGRGQFRRRSAGAHRQFNNPSNK